MEDDYKVGPSFLPHCYPLRSLYVQRPVKGQTQPLPTFYLDSFLPGSDPDHGVTERVQPWAALPLLRT